MAGSSNIGRIVPIYKGDFSNTATYVGLDEVHYQGDYYRVKFRATPPVGTLPTNATFWHLIFTIEPKIQQYYEDITANANDFNKRYLGTQESAPVVDNNGDPLVNGALYFNLTDDSIYVYVDDEWDKLIQDFGDVVPSTRQIATINGLEGGGQLTSNLQLGLTAAVRASLVKADNAAVKTIKVIAGSGLTGGGTLESDSTFDLSAATLASLVKADNSVPTTRKITAGTGIAISGDGSLSADRTIALTSAVIASLAKADTLGSLGTQNASAVNITGGTVVGITDVAIADGGTGASSKADARTNLEVYSKAEIDLLLASAVPAGALVPFALPAAPTGWLKANGGLYSRTAYARLYAAIGTTFGAGDGVTTFAVPELRGEWVRGLDDGRGIDADRVLGSYQADQNKAHTHGVNDPGHFHYVGASYIGSGNSSNGGYINNSPNTGAYSSTSYTGISIQSSGGDEVRVRNVAALYCIKY